MADDAYRAELGAAQARIARLEDELRERSAAAPPALAALEAAHAKLVGGVPGRVRLATIAAWAVFALMAAPVVYFEAKYEPLSDALIGCALMGGVPFVVAALMPWIVRKDSATRVASSAKKLAEARRLHQLEAQIRVLADEARAPHVRVASSSGDGESGDPEADEMETNRERRNASEAKR